MLHDRGSRPSLQPDGSGEAHAHYDWASDLPSTAVVQTVAAAAGCNPVTLDPLYEFVDPDALNELFIHDLGANGGAAVSFAFADFQVTIHGNGDVVARKRGVLP